MTNTLPDSAPSVAAPRPDPWATVKETYRIGAVVTGTVRHLTDYGAFINLAPGITGMIHISKLSHEMDKLPSELVSVGQKLEVEILRIQPALRKIKLGLKQTADAWKTVGTKYAVGQKIQGKVIRLTYLGVKVELEPGVAGLVPTAEISWATQQPRPDDAFAPGQEVAALVVGIDCEKRKIILSIRQLGPDPWDKVEAKYPVGARVKGTASKLVRYGAFVDLDKCICGMVHVSDMSWLRRINHPSEFLKKGGEVEAMVLEVDRANRRLALGIKQLVQDPWETIEQLYKVGDLVNGRVVKLVTFGAFVELRHELDGLVHISQISGQPVAEVEDVLKVGQDVIVSILNIDRHQRRIGLTMLVTRNG